MLQVRLLGAVEVLVGDHGVDVGPPKQRLLLAALAVDAGRPVAPETLVDRVWGEAPPQDARKVLHTYVARLRRVLDHAERESGEPLKIVRHAGGYQFDVDRSRVDLHRFRTLVDHARMVLTHHPQRADLLDEALEQWSSDALDGLPGEWALRIREGLLQQWFGALIEWADAALGLGRHHEVLERLSTVVSRHPLVEPAIGRLMQALSAAGRDAEALDVYAKARLRLAEELGTEPGPQLRALHTDLLHGAMIAVAHHPSQPGHGETRPAQLPLDVRSFVGRHGELATLNRFTAASDGDAHTVGVVAITGTAGVGKTALAVHWAHQVVEQFGDGQLYLNLRGFSPDQPPMSAAEAVRALLESLQVPAKRIPDGFDTQVALYRSILAHRRALIVLDNACDVDQVRPLLPGAPRCLTIVTSRNGLFGLIAKEGAEILSLDVLCATEAHQLFTGRVGSDRVAAEAQAAEAIVARCAGLPLALAVVAARVVIHRRFALAALAEELRESPDSLDGLHSVDPASDVRTVFSWSYAGVGAAAARLFRLLGLHPGPDIAAAAAASLTGTTKRIAQRLLAELADANLVTEHLPGRYALHDLLRSYAGELAYAVDDAALRRAALRRMLDHYLHTAHAAAILCDPHRVDPVQLSAVPPDVTPENLADSGRAQSWFTVEHPVLLAAVPLAARAGFDRHTWQLAWAVAQFLFRQGRWDDVLTVQHVTLAAARRLNDQTGQAHAHRLLGVAHLGRGDFEQARSHNRHALDLFGTLGDHAGQGYAHLGINIGYDREGRPQDALLHARHALELFRTAGHRAGQAKALNGIGWLSTQLGDTQAAVNHCREALAIHQEIGDRWGAAHNWDSLGYTQHRLGNHTAADDCYRRALDLFRQTGDSFYTASTLTRLGDSQHARGDVDGARRAWREALDILDKLDHPDADPIRARLADLEPTLSTPL